jgi:hypothetical protein
VGEVVEDIKNGGVKIKKKLALVASVNTSYPFARKQ